MSQFSNEFDPDNTPEPNGLESLHQMATQGMVMPVLMDLADRWAVWRCSPDRLDTIAAHLAIGALIRHAYDEGGPLHAVSLLADMQTAVANARGYVRGRARDDREQATGRRLMPRGKVRA